MHSNKLIITNYGNEDASNGTVDFDGSVAKTVDVVDASGGTFTGPIKIVIPEGSTEKIGEDEDVPTIKLVNDIVTDLKGVPLLSWKSEGNELKNITKAADTTVILPIKVVYGTKEDYSKFCDYIKNSEKDKGYYLYLAKQSHQMTLYMVSSNGTSDISNFSIGSYKIVSTDIDDAYYDFDTLTSTFNKLSTDISLIRDNSGYSDEPSLKQLHDEINVLKTGLGELAARISGVVGNEDDYDNGLNGLRKRVTDIVNGIITVAYANTAFSATKASQDSDGNIIKTNYYKSNSNTAEVNSIYIKTSDPTTATGSDATLASNAKVGDIWIVYKTN